MAFEAKKRNKGHRSRTTPAAIKEAVKEERKSIIIRVPVSELKKFKRKLLEVDKTAQSFVLEAIRDFIDD